MLGCAHCCLQVISMLLTTFRGHSEQSIIERAGGVHSCPHRRLHIHMQDMGRCTVLMGWHTRKAATGSGCEQRPNVSTTVSNDCGLNVCSTWGYGPSALATSTATSAVVRTRCCASPSPTLTGTLMSSRSANFWRACHSIQRLLSIIVRDKSFFMS